MRSRVTRRDAARFLAPTAPARLGIPVDGVEVEATARFPGPGLAASSIQCRVRVSSPADPDAGAGLVRRTDAVADAHDTVKSGVPVVLVDEGPQAARTRYPLGHR